MYLYRDEKSKTMMKIERGHSIAEFFAKNKQFLGYVNPQRSLLTVVKELLDNAMDIVEESKVKNPIIKLEVKNIRNDVYLVKCEDNGKGISEDEVPHVFCKFLYGHKFLEKKQTRGQQGIGITGAVLYAQQSTGNPVTVISKTVDNDVGYKYKLMIDVKKNEPVIIEKEEVECDVGTKVEMTVKGRFSERINEYVSRTALTNPHVTIIFNDKVFKAKNENNFNLKPIPVTPSDLDYLEFKEILKNSERVSVASFIYHTFKGIGWIRAKEIEKKIGKSSILELNEDDIKRLYLTLKGIKLRIRKDEAKNAVYGFGKEVIENYLKLFRPEKILIRISEPEIYENEVYQIEVGCGYGAASEIEIHRFANRMPLLYSPSACLITKTVNEVNWKYYKARKGMLLLVHIASTHIPYSEQSKDAIAEHEFIRKKLTRLLQMIGREIKKWERYKEKESYIKKLEEDYKKLGEILE